MRRTRARPLIGAALIAGGTALVLWALGVGEQPSANGLEFRLEAAGPVERFPELGLQDHPTLAVERYALRISPIDQPLVRFTVARPEGDAPVLLDWQNLVAEPIVTMDTQAAELAQLARAVRQHAPAGSPIFAWWDIGQQLKLLTGHEVLVAANLLQPLLLPSLPEVQRARIEQELRAFWQAEADPDALGRFTAFVEALLEDAAAGVRRLRQLAGGREAHVVLHVADAYRIGVLRPDRYAIGFRDFQRSSDIHGLIQRVKAWLREQGHASYLVMPLDKSHVRVFFLTDKQSQDRLITRLLPFSTAGPASVDGLSLVYQVGDYWVYRLQPEDATADDGRPEAGDVGSAAVSEVSR